MKSMYKDGAIVDVLSNMIDDFKRTGWSISLPKPKKASKKLESKNE